MVNRVVPRPPSYEIALSGLQEPPYRLPTDLMVAVVVPTLDEELRLPLLLTTARNQTYPVWRAIVVDCSGDERTASVARAHGAEVIKVPYGNLAAQRNAGAAAAGGADVLIFCDADVLLPSSFVETAVAMLEDYHAVHPREVLYDSDLWNGLTFPWASLLRPRLYTSRCVAVRAVSFVEAGGYDEACNPLEGCREDLSLGRNVGRRFGRWSVEVMPEYIGTSARRYVRQGIRLGLSGFAEAVR